jgi:hypothetical protein
MRRKKRFSIGWIALGLAVVAMVPVTAEAKPLPTDQSQAQYELGPAEIPYLSHGKGMPVFVIGSLSPETLSPDDRAFSRVDSTRQVEIPYLSHGVGVTQAELGFATGGSPDDRSHLRAYPEATTLVATDDGSRIDVNPYVVTGFGLALLLLAGGMGIAIRHSRKTTLSPA